MIKNFYKIISLVFSLFFLIHQTALSASFNENLINIREEINRDNLDEAINKLKKITVSSDIEQENINILFGDIYLKINQPQKAEEFYNESLFTSDDNIEALTFTGLADVRLLQGRLDDAVKYSEKSISINPNLIRPKIILAIAKTRLGEDKEAYKILNNLYYIKKNAEVSLALANYFIAFDDKDKAGLDDEYYAKIMFVHPPRNSASISDGISSDMWRAQKDMSDEMLTKVKRNNKIMVEFSGSANIVRAD